MQKIKRSLLDKIMKDKKMTRHEMNVLFFFIKISDEMGEAQGISYKEVMNEVGCSSAEFYKAIKTLKERKYIRVYKMYIDDLEIMVLDNKFSDFTDYLNLNNLIFNAKMKFKKNFYELRAGAKKMLLYIYNRVAASKGERQRFVQGNFVKIMQDLLGYKTRTVKSYIEEISEYVDKSFNVYVKGKIYDFITIKKSLFQKPKAFMTVITSDAEPFREPKEIETSSSFARWQHFIKTICRRGRIEADTLNINDCAIIAQQHAPMFKKLGGDFSIKDVITDSIYKTRENAKLNAKFIHRMVITVLERAIQSVESHKGLSFEDYEDIIDLTELEVTAYKNEYNVKKTIGVG